MMRILVIRFSSLGDVVLATAPLRALHSQNPDAEIVFATKQEYMPLLDSFPGWLKVVPFGPGQSISEYRKSIGVGPFDLIVDLHGSLRSRHLMLGLKSRQTRRVDKSTIRRFLMVWSKKGLDAPVSVVSSYLRAAGVTDSVYPKLELSNQEKAQASERSRRYPNRIGIGWGAKHPTKVVPADFWNRLIQGTSNGSPAHFELFGLESDRREIEVFIREGFGTSGTITLELSVGLPLRETMSRIAACTLFISCDSGLMHVADALGVPTFGLFGPTHPSLGFAPAGPRSKAFHAGTWCSPCHRHGSAPCFRERRFCFAELNSDLIASAVTEILQSDKTEVPLQ